MGQAESTAGAPAVGSEPMRELSIAQSLVDIATRHANGRPVRKVEVSVGRLRKVDPETLDLAFGLVTQGTALDGAQLKIDMLAGDELWIDALELEAGAGRS
jgi:Zn finger protein HypA/HybF involved in hydrogenase expression